MESRGRFAPSPTGELHLGNARTALLAWLWARAEGGTFAMRVEDLDRPRVRPGLAERQLDELRWLGLDWDGATVFQSQRTAVYQEALHRLRDHVYECFCSRAEIAAAASAPHGDEGPRYPGICADLTAAQRAQRRKTRPPSLRLRVPPGLIGFTDEIAGAQALDVQAMTGDFVLRRADGIFAYQLAVTVDDGAMGITQVLRGADLISSTPRQILLHRLLGQTEPRWAHAPLLLSEAGERLSKRERPQSLSALREAGRDPGKVIALLARLSGIQEAGGRDACKPQDLLGGFSLSRVPRAAARVGNLP
jgi:glutamyl-tRNA synthetase